MKATFCFWSSYYYDLNFEEAVSRFIDNGVCAIELSSEHAKELYERDEDIYATASSVRAYLEEKGMTMTQGHLPLRFKIVEQRDEISDVLRYIDFYEALGIRSLVLHCDRMYGRPHASAEERIRENVISLKIIAEHIQNKDIYICLENLRAPTVFPVDDPIPLGLADDLIRIIDAVGSERFAICLDTGHLNLVGETNQEEFILKAGSRLRALHIADNQNYYDLDEHLMPFGRGKVDFFAVVRGLRKVSYEGMFNYELPGENKAPLPIRDAKIQYIKICYDYLMSQE